MAPGEKTEIVCMQGRVDTTDGLHARLPLPGAPPAGAAADGEPEAEPAMRTSRAEEQARTAVAYLLRETRAYRKAYATEPLEALFSSQ